MIIFAIVHYSLLQFALNIIWLGLSQNFRVHLTFNSLNKNCSYSTCSVYLLHNRSNYNVKACTKAKNSLSVLITSFFPIKTIRIFWTLQKWYEIKSGLASVTVYGEISLSWFFSDTTKVKTLSLTSVGFNLYSVLVHAPDDGNNQQQQCA